MPSKKFADGWEIQQYCRSIAEKFDFAGKALFHTQITSLRWDEGIQRWRIATNRGDDIRARFVTLACGVLNMPKLPGLPGIDQFKRSEEHTSELQSLMRISYAVFCLKKKNLNHLITYQIHK